MLIEGESPLQGRTYGLVHPQAPREIPETASNIGAEQCCQAARAVLTLASGLLVDAALGWTRPFLDPPARMLGDPFLDLDLALAGTVEWKLQGGTVVGRHLDVDVLADERRIDQASCQYDGLKHGGLSCISKRLVRSDKVSFQEPDRAARPRTAMQHNRRWTFGNWDASSHI